MTPRARTPRRVTPLYRLMPLVLACIATTASACTTLLPPTADRNPTRPEGAGPQTQIDVGADSRSTEPMVITVSQRGSLAGTLTIGPCEAATMTLMLDPPFTIGAGPASDFHERPMPRLVDWSELEPDGDDYRVRILIEPDGEVSHEPLDGTGSRRPPGC